MKDFVFIENNQNGSSSLVTLKEFKKLRFMLSDNATYKYLTADEACKLNA